MGEVEEETGEATAEMGQGSPASTAEAKDTRPPIARAPRNLEEMDATRGKEVEVEKAGKPL